MRVGERGRKKSVEGKDWSRKMGSVREEIGKYRGEEKMRGGPRNSYLNLESFIEI